MTAQLKTSLRKMQNQATVYKVNDEFSAAIDARANAKFIKNKIENFSHQEHNLEHITDVDAIQKKMDAGIDLYMRPGETFERIAICDNDYLPPFYETHLSSFI